MTYRVLLTATARDEFLEAFRWLAERSPEAADRWRLGFEAALLSLADRPDRHLVAEEESRQLGVTLRLLLHGRRRGVYQVLFSIEGETVVLHRVRHGARGPLET